MSADLAGRIGGEQRNSAHLIEQKKVPRLHETADDLNAATLSVGNLVHVPREIDVAVSRSVKRSAVGGQGGEGLIRRKESIQDVEETVAPLLVAVASDRVAARGKDQKSDKERGDVNRRTGNERPRGRISRQGSQPTRFLRMRGNVNTRCF